MDGATFGQLVSVEGRKIGIGQAVGCYILAGNLHLHIKTYLTFYFQVTRLLANHRRRLQLQRKRKPPANAVKDDAKDSSINGDKENRLDNGVEQTETDKLIMEHVQSVVDEMAGRTASAAKLNMDEDTRMVSRFGMVYQEAFF